MKDCIRCEHRMCVFVCVCVTEREKERRKVITFQSKHFLWTRLVSECGEISFSSFFHFGWYKAHTNPASGFILNKMKEEKTQKTREIDKQWVTFFTVWYFFAGHKRLLK